MTADEHSATIDDTYSFRTPGDNHIDVTVGTLTIDESVTAEFRLPWERWRRAVDGGLFHLDTTTQPPTFEEGRPVELSARLRAAFVRELADDADKVVERFADSSDPLRSTEGWFVTEVAQTTDPPDTADSEVTPVSISSETEWAAYDPANGDDSVLDVVTDTLDRQGWHYEVVESNYQYLRFDVALDETRAWSMVVHVDEVERRCTLYSIFPVAIPYEDRPEAALALMSVNYDLNHGSFEFDVTDGVVSFRTRVLVDAEPFIDALGMHVDIVTEQYDTIARWGGDGETPAVDPDRPLSTASESSDSEVTDSPPFEGLRGTESEGDVASDDLLAEANSESTADTESGHTAEDDS